MFFDYAVVVVVNAFHLFFLLLSLLLLASLSSKLLLLVVVFLLCLTVDLILFFIFAFPLYATLDEHKVLLSDLVVEGDTDVDHLHHLLPFTGCPIHCPL